MTKRGDKMERKEELMNTEIENKLVKFSEEESDNIMKNIPMMFSRVRNVLDEPLKVIDKGKLELLEKRTKEINEKMYIFGRRDSHATRKLMSLQMLSTADSTYRVLKQILAQVEKKQMAISESHIKLNKDYLRIDELERSIEKLQEKILDEKSESAILDLKIKKKKLDLSRKKKLIDISNSFIYLEGALKEVGLLQDAYEQIKKNKNIPDDWDEMDFEKEEIAANIRSAFRNCLRDFMCSGRIHMGTTEYFEQFGISPFEAIYHVKNYVENCNQKMNRVTSEKDFDRLPDYDDFHDFLNRMAELYKDNYKKACKRMGLDNVISEKFLVMSLRNKVTLELPEGDTKDD
jgi:hypothetical protein